MGLFGNDTESTWAKRALIDLTTTRALPVSAIYDLLHEYEFSLDEIREGAVYNYEEEIRKTRRRIKRIAKRLVVAGADGGEPPLTAPKVYDSVLQAGMLTTFNNVVAKAIDGPEIHTIVNKDFLKRTGTETVPSSAKYALAAQGFALDIFLDGRPENVSLSECVLYTCLCAVIHHRIFFTLTKEASSQLDRKRAQRLFEQIDECIHSELIHDALTRTILDFLDDYLVTELNVEREQHIRLSWFPLKYRKRKDFERALKKMWQKNMHLELQANDPDDVDYDVFGDEKSQIKQADISAWAEHIRSSWVLSRGEWMHDVIFPLVQLIAMRIIPSDLNSKEVDVKEMVLQSEQLSEAVKGIYRKKEQCRVPAHFYNYACQIAAFIDNLISAVLQETSELIYYMPSSVWDRQSNNED